MADRNQPGRRVRWASVEPLLDPGFEPSILDGLNWVVVGARTGPPLRATSAEAAGVTIAAERICNWGSRHRVPVFVKDNLRRLLPGAEWPRLLPLVEDACH